MSLFSYLEGVKRKTAFDRGSEALFFGENSYLLSSHEPFQPYLHPKTPFQVARSNILIRAIVNKRVIERLYLSRAILAEKEGRLGKEEFMKEAVLELPFLLLENGEKVYVPFFSRALNRIYAGDYGKMERMPYKRILGEFDSIVVDPFDYWGSALFDSHFTRLVKVAGKDGALAMYDYDAERLHFIAPEGRLEVTLPLFDRFLHNPARTHLMRRLEDVGAAYFANDREGFYKALYEGRLLSREALLRYRKIALREGKEGPPLLWEER